MRLIFIHGAPAAGKLTVANEIARLTGYKVFHNHLSIDAVKPIFEFGTASFWRLVNSIRFETIGEAARTNVNLIYTFCYAQGADDAHVAKIVETVESNGGTICFVLLRCARTELENRVVARSRKRFGKANNTDVLREILDKYNFSSPVPHRASLEIDNTRLSARAVAKRVVEHYRLVV